MITKHCSRCGKLIEITEEDNLKEYKTVDTTTPCCKLSTPEEKLLAAIFRKET